MSNGWKRTSRIGNGKVNKTDLGLNPKNKFIGSRSISFVFLFANVSILISIPP